MDVYHVYVYFNDEKDFGTTTSNKIYNFKPASSDDFDSYGLYDVFCKADANIDNGYYSAQILFMYKKKDEFEKAVKAYSTKSRKTRFPIKHYYTKDGNKKSSAGPSSAQDNKRINKQNREASKTSKYSTAKGILDEYKKKKQNDDKESCSEPSCSSIKRKAAAENTEIHSKKLKDAFSDLSDNDEATLSSVSQKDSSVAIANVNKLKKEIDDLKYKINKMKKQHGDEVKALKENIEVLTKDKVSLEISVRSLADSLEIFKHQLKEKEMNVVAVPLKENNDINITSIQDNGYQLDFTANIFNSASIAISEFEKQLSHSQQESPPELENSKPELDDSQSELTVFLQPELEEPIQEHMATEGVSTQYISFKEPVAADFIQYKNEKTYKLYGKEVLVDGNTMIDIGWGKKVPSMSMTYMTTAKDGKEFLRVLLKATLGDKYGKYTMTGRDCNRLKKEKDYKPKGKMPEPYYSLIEAHHKTFCILQIVKAGNVSKVEDVKNVISSTLLQKELKKLNTDVSKIASDWIPPSSSV